MSHDLAKPSDSEMDSFLSNVPTPNLFQTHFMAKTYARTKGCRPWLNASFGGDGGVHATLASTWFRDAPGLAHASIRGGPMWLNTPDGVEGAFELLKAHERIAKLRTLYTRIYPVSAPQSSVEIALRCGFQSSPWINYLIPLTSLESLWNRLGKDRKRGIQKAERTTLRARDATSDKDVDAAVGVLRATASLDRFPLQHASLFHAVQEILAPRKLARIVMAELDGETVAVRVLLTYRETIYDWYAGSLPSHRHSQVDAWLVWHTLQWGLDQGYRVFDFGGAGSPEVPYGPRDFKKRFGGDEVRLSRSTNSHYPRVQRLLESIYSVTRGHVSS